MSYQELGIKKHTILIVDDDLENCETLSQILSHTYNVLMAQNGEDGIRMAKQESPTLVLLDIQMPKMNGLDACQKLKADEATRDLPVVMLSGSSDDEKLVKAFSLGADDYVEKPFKAKELLARISSKIQKLEVKVEKNNIITWDSLTLDCLKFEARVKGTKLELTVLEFNLLKFFVTHRNEVLSRQRIMSVVWKITVSSRSIDTHLCQIKAKIKDTNLTFTSVYGKGYMLSDGKNADSSDDSVAA
jgi:DNA-binding response OmpR family regulator